MSPDTSNGTLIQTDGRSLSKVSFTESRNNKSIILLTCCCSKKYLKE